MVATRTARVEVKVEELAASSPALAATGSGTYRRSGDGAQAVDIALRASRMDGRAVRGLIPALRPDTGEWLKRAIVAAPLTDVRVRLRGDLDDFPYDDPKKGEMRASARVTDGVLEYAPGWPQLTGITADLLFEGRKMVVTSSRASQLRCPGCESDCGHPRPHRALRAADRRADRAVRSADYLKFIAASPVRGFIDGRDRRVVGDGRAQLAAPSHVAAGEDRATKVSGRPPVRQQRHRDGGGRTRRSRR